MPVYTLDWTFQRFADDKNAWVCSFEIHTSWPSWNATADADEESCQPLLDKAHFYPGKWRPGGGKEGQIKNCLMSKLMEELCRVNFDIDIAISAIFCNFFQMVILVGIAIWYLTPDRLLVVGDAIQSFLSLPDRLTEGSCLAGKRHVVDSSCPGGPPWTGPRELNLDSKRWMSSVSTRRWVVGAFS
jgi:hypothetical protein